MRAAALVPFPQQHHPREGPSALSVEAVASADAPPLPLPTTSRRACQDCRSPRNPTLFDDPLRPALTAPMDETHVPARTGSTSASRLLLWRSKHLAATGSVEKEHSPLLRSCWPSDATAPFVHAARRAQGSSAGRGCSMTSCHGIAVAGGDWGDRRAAEAPERLCPRPRGVVRARCPGCGGASGMRARTARRPAPRLGLAAATIGQRSPAVGTELSAPRPAHPKQMNPGKISAYG